MKNKALALYKSAFPEDSNEFAEDFIEKYFDNCRFLTENGELVSMLFLFECELSLKETVYPAYYLYAAATNAAYRGRGYMRRLIEKVKQDVFYENKLLITKPANKELFSFYGKLGFKEAFYYCEELYLKESDEKADFKEITAYEYYKKRELFLRKVPHVSFKKHIDFAADSLLLLESKNTLASVDTSGDIPVIKEFISADGREKDALLSFLNTDKAVIRETKPQTPFAMLLSPDDILLPDSMYMGLAMD